MISAAFIVASITVNAQWWNFTEPAALPGTVNALESEESMPVFSKDSSILYFVRTFDPNNTGGENDQDIWQSSRQSDGSYTGLTRVKNLNNKFNNASVGISKDGTKMYVLSAYEGKKDMAKGIAVSESKNGKWGAPETIQIPGLDIEGAFYGFHVSEKGDVILISYKGPGSLGEEDLYVSTKTGDTWSAPVHMGSDINSAGFEISPFLTASQDTLFFSSNGMGGEGDADIFYSVRQGSWTSWSKPKNLGDRINSPKFDAYFNYTGKYAYWSSNREGERSDIYMIEILPPPPISLSCTATNASKHNKEDGKVELTITGGAPPFSFAWSNNSTSEVAKNLGRGEYSVVVTDAIGQVATSSCFVDAPAKPIDPVVVKMYEDYEFKHIFGYNKNKLSVNRGDLKKFVKSIEKDLKDGRQSVTIKIVSSASNVPTQTYGTNEKLAEIRAENMKYDLLDHFKKKYAENVNVVVVSSKVDGPAYEQDAQNRSKYEPYQFVELKTE